MSKLKLQMQMSLDGFVAGPNGEMDWLTWNWDAELMKYVGELTDTFDIILLGRKLAESFIPTWESRLSDPETADDSARKMVNTPKIVFSKTLKKSEWANAELAQDTAGTINKLKAQSGQDMIVYGGGSFVASLIKDNLIDEYNLFVNPVALGSGMAIFSSLEEELKLNLVSSKAFACGVVALRCEPKKG